MMIMDIIWFPFIIINMLYTIYTLEVIKIRLYLGFFFMTLELKDEFVKQGDSAMEKKVTFWFFVQSTIFFFK